MNNTEYEKISELESSGLIDEAHSLLLKLSEENHPMAVLELADRFYSVECYVNPVYPLAQDLEKSKALAHRGKAILEKMVEEGDGEACRMLAYTYLGFWGPFHEFNRNKAEELLLASYEANCLFSANELSTFYLGSDLDKASYWYNIAEQHGVRVIYYPECDSQLKSNT